MKELELNAFMPYRLARISHLLSDDFAFIYEKKYGLTMPQWRAIAHLAESSPLSAKVIGDKAGLDKSTLSRAIKQLTDAALIIKTMDPNDKRASLLCLSQKGQAMFATLSQEAIKWQAQLFSDLSEQEIKQLFDALTYLEAKLG